MSAQLPDVAMGWNQVRLDQVVPAPWRNGGGLTRELAAWPPGDEWNWRMSVAEVARDGPFSRFDGVQRCFAVLGGAGVRLDIGGRRHELSANSEPLCFDGALATFCELLHGPTQDFNLMARQGRAQARMRRVRGVHQVTLPEAMTLALYVVQGPAEFELDNTAMQLPVRTLVWQRLQAKSSLRLAATHGLWMEIEA